MPTKRKPTRAPAETANPGPTAPKARVIDAATVDVTNLLAIAERVLTAGRRHVLWQSDSDSSDTGNDYLLELAGAWAALESELAGMGLLDDVVTVRGEAQAVRPWRALRELGRKQRERYDFDEKFLGRLADTVGLLRRNCTGEPAWRADPRLAWLRRRHPRAKTLDRDFWFFLMQEKRKLTPAAIRELCRAHHPEWNLPARDTAAREIVETGIKQIRDRLKNCKLSGLSGFSPR